MALSQTDYSYFKELDILSVLQTGLSFSKNQTVYKHSMISQFLSVWSEGYLRWQFPRRWKQPACECCCSLQQTFPIKIRKDVFLHIVHYFFSSWVFDIYVNITGISPYYRNFSSDPAIAKPPNECLRWDINCALQKVLERHWKDVTFTYSNKYAKAGASTCYLYIFFKKMATLWQEYCSIITMVLYTNIK